MGFTQGRVSSSGAFGAYLLARLVTFKALPCPRRQSCMSCGGGFPACGTEVKEHEFGGPDGSESSAPPGLVGAQLTKL